MTPDLPTTWRTAFERCVEHTLRIAKSHDIPDPPVHLAPCWHAMVRLEEAGKPSTEPNDPLVAAAFWEWLAWVGEQAFGKDAEHFAIECRAMADVAILGDKAA